MKKTNTIKRNMTDENIIKSFGKMFHNRDWDTMKEFVELYPSFTERYIALMLGRIEDISFIISEIRENE